MYTHCPTILYSVIYKKTKNDSFYDKFSLQFTRKIVFFSQFFILF